MTVFLGDPQIFVGLEMKLDFVRVSKDEDFFSCALPETLALLGSDSETNVQDNF